MLYYLLYHQSLSFSQVILSFVFTIFAFIVSLSVHEFAHALVAYKMGDPTPKLTGRLTLNPFKHIDTSGFIMFMLFGVGWAKPVQVNPLNFKKFRKGMRLVAIAGVCANFLLGLICAIIFALLFKFVGPVNQFVVYLYDLLSYFMLVNSFLVLFNLLPIYPFDGFSFITTFMKGDNKFIRFSVKNSFYILLAVFLVSIITDLAFGFDILDLYCMLIYDKIYMPIVFLGVL